MVFKILTSDELDNSIDSNYLYPVENMMNRDRNEVLETFKHQNKPARAICPFNYGHQMSKRSLRKHLFTCPDKMKQLVALQKDLTRSPTVFSPRSQKVFVFDLETDSLTTDFPTLSREEYFEHTNMTVGVGCFGDSYYYFSTLEEDLNRLEKLFDLASVIVVQNHSFDFGVLCKYFKHRDIGEWHTKVFDFYDCCRSLFGTPIPMDELSKVGYKIPQKLGKSKDAPRLWRQSRLDELYLYCKRDVEILKRLYENRKNLHVPVYEDDQFCGVIAINCETGIIPALPDGTQYPDYILKLALCPSLPTKCKYCLEKNRHCHPAKVIFEGVEENVSTEDNSSSEESL